MEQKAGWRFRRGRWVSLPRIPVWGESWTWRKAELVEMLTTGEDVELYAAELGISRRELH